MYSNWLIKFSIIRVWPKRLNAVREVNKRLKWLQWLCPLRDHQRRAQAFWANLAMVDHKTHGYLDKICVPCVDRRDTGGKTDWYVSFANSQAIGRGNAPDADEQWGPLGHWQHHSQKTDRAQGQKWPCVEMASIKGRLSLGWSLKWLATW